MNKFTLFIFIVFFTALFAEGVPPSGSGEENDPYQIFSLDNLLWLSTTEDIWDDNAYFIQTADINASDTQNWNIGEGFSPIGNLDLHFYGNYDGQGFVVDSLFINRPSESCQGLFGSIISTIENIGVTNIHVNGHLEVGGLIGHSDNDSSIENCYSMGSVSGDNMVGGLVGDIYYSTIVDCYSMGSVSGNEGSTGGLVGYCVSTIVTNCYNASSVEGWSEVQGTGGLVGLLDAYNSLTGCYNTGSVTGVINTGGLVGWSAGYNSLTHCYNTGIVSATDNFTGGLVGYNKFHCTISNSSNTGNVSGLNLGGLVGRNEEYCSISDSYNVGNVNGVWFSGGLVGTNRDSCSISNCYSSGCVIGGGYSGGLSGDNDSNSDITNCYSSGIVSGVYSSAGLIARNFATISNCYSLASVSGDSQVGGLVAFNSGSVTASFWDTETSGQITSDGGSGKTTAEMQTLATFIDAGWDFMDEATNGEDDYWGINPAENNGYPFLEWQGYIYNPNTVTPLNVNISLVSNTLNINWDDTGANWYGIYSGSTPSNLSYLGWTSGNSVIISVEDNGFYQITSGYGTPSGTQLDN